MGYRDAEYICDVCSKVFPTQAELIEHLDDYDHWEALE